MSITAHPTQFLGRALGMFGVVVIVVAPLINAPGLAAPASTGTFQDFDSPGTPSAIYVQLGPPPITVMGGPTDSGQFMRLAFGAPAPTSTHASLAFNRTHTGTAQVVVADFDFRMTPGFGRADGMGFALLNTANYGIAGAIAPNLLPPGVAEEPNFTGSLGIGFDIYQSSDPPPTELNNNHLSLHYNGAKLAEFDAGPIGTLDLGGGEWIHARVTIQPGSVYSDVTVTLTPCGGPAATIISSFPVTGFVPYEGRAYFAARSGYENADQDLDNVRVQFLDSSQGVMAFSTGCYPVVESDGLAQLTVTRAGDVSAPASLFYTTSDLTATAGSDYTPISGTLTFTNGEASKIVSIPITDDVISETAESFLITLSDPTGNGVVGGPAVAKVTIVDNELYQQTGAWGEVIDFPTVPIHAHLLPTGQVMFWDRHNENPVWDGNPYLWNPTTGLITATSVLTYDLFCAGHSFLPDGRLLVTGGHILDAVGEDEASIYDPFTDTWQRLPAMNNGRWYPSNVTLANGEVLVMAGTFITGQVNLIPQVWQTYTSTWRTLTTAPQPSDYPEYADLYPYLYAAPNGQVFVAGPQPMARYLDPTGTGAWMDVAASAMPYRDYGSSVMYDDGQVLIVGGSEDRTMYTTTASAEVINLNDVNPAWRSVASMNFPRRHLNTTLLPDGTVLVTGGSSIAAFDDPVSAVLEAELWDPNTEQWTLLAAQTRYRGYHSVALLLPDGRVMVGGGGHPDTAAGAQNNIEIFSPPYLFQGPRPTIAAAPTQAVYGHSFLVQTTDVISNVTWIRLGSVTHAFNQNQRINHLSFTLTTDGLIVNVPSDPNLAPPGHYMLFILNGNGVPSVAHIIQLVSHATYLPMIRR